MLYCFFLAFKFARYIQSGLYIDYIFKKISEIFVKNFFICSAIIFGEKFIIEFITKKIIDNYTLLTNIKLFDKTYFFTTFFSQVLIFFLYAVSLFEIIYLCI
jgi:hypothetical protein